MHNDISSIINICLFHPIQYLFSKKYRHQYQTEKNVRNMQYENKKYSSINVFCKKRLGNVFFPNKRTSFLIYMFLIGFIFSFLYEISFSSKIYKSFLICILSLTCTVIGGFFGFLFGMPKNPPKKEKETVNLSDKKDENERIYFQENTNLQEISDWVTKIIVGVGLTQFRSIYSEFIIVSKKISLDTSIGPETVSGMIIFYFYIVGFFASYFWAKIDYNKLMNSKIDKKLDEKFSKARESLDKKYSKIEDNININQEVIKISNILSSKSEKLDVKTKAQYIPILKDILSKNPYNRMATIVLARFYAELYNEYYKSINLLSEFIQYKYSKNEKDIDLADALYNKSIYELKSGNKSGFIKDMRKSCDIFPANKNYAKDDPELENLHSDQEFVKIIS